MTFAVPLGKVLIAFVIDFEGESTISLAISANVFRLVETAGVRSAIYRTYPGSRKKRRCAAPSWSATAWLASAWTLRGPDSRLCRSRGAASVRASRTST
jgi:hypothetical protein